jgi:DNA-binding transcriptional regulator LsrR (DeoR family)
MICSKEELTNLYHNERLSQETIAKRFGVTSGAITWRATQF